MRQKYIPQVCLIVFLFFTSIISRSQNFSAVHNWLKDNTGVMGGRTVLMIYKDGKIIYTDAVNDMNMRQKMAAKIIARRQGKEANTDDYTTTTRIPVASCSKWFSAALVMTFVDEGKLQLTDTVGKFLPVLTQHGKGGITISECLSHTTSINEPSLKERLPGMQKAASMDEAIEQVAELPMEGEPGGVFHYSNAGLQIAGAVIEKISGKSFETLFAERIAQPLGMANTDFGKGKVALPAGGAFSNAEDYLKFLVMILNKGVYNGKRILSESSIAAMQVNQVTSDVKVTYSPAEAGNLGYGYGEWVWDSTKVSNLSKAVTSPGLFGSFPWVDNEKHYCAILLAFYIQSQGRNERYKELKGLVDEAVK